LAGEHLTHTRSTPQDKLTQIVTDSTWRGFASLSRNQKVRPARKSRNTLIIKRLCSVTAKNTHKKREDEGL
jgi:hypothetical protein